MPESLKPICRPGPACLYRIGVLEGTGILDEIMRLAESSSASLTVKEHAERILNICTTSSAEMS